MLLQNHTQKKIVAKLSDHQIIRIKDFIQGSIYCHCKYSEEKWFTASDLFGGVNHIWSGTPLYALYDWHLRNGSRDPDDMAGKDVGWLLLNVIIEDKRIFQLEEAYTHRYKWTGKEQSSV